MTEPDPIDPFARLWQSAPAPDTERLMHDLRRLQAVHRWQNRILIAILSGTAILLVFGAIATQSAGLRIAATLWVAFVIGAIWYQGVRCRAADALDLDTISLLKRMIKRAKRGLVQARRLYAGTPLAAAVSWTATRFFWPGLASGGHVMAPWLATTYTLASLAMLGAMVAAGLGLARARRRQLDELSEKLRLFEGEV
jgi:hypothetical protein